MYVYMHVYIYIYIYTPLPEFEIEISHKTFSGKRSSYATGPRPNACHVMVFKRRRRRLLLRTSRTLASARKRGIAIFVCCMIVHIILSRRLKHGIAIYPRCLGVKGNLSEVGWIA